MKKIILLALTALIMVGCERVMETDYHTKEGFRVCIIDSCEYILMSNGNGAYYTHKGNCRFCKERRQEEMEELVRVWKERKKL